MRIKITTPKGVQTSIHEREYFASGIDEHVQICIENGVKEYDFSDLYHINGKSYESTFEIKFSDTYKNGNYDTVVEIVIRKRRGEYGMTQLVKTFLWENNLINNPDLMELYESVNLIFKQFEKINNGQ